jgi:hypothetical protein
VSTMHRRLRQAGENGEGRHQRAAQHHAVPRLLARAPNEVWTSPSVTIVVRSSDTCPEGARGAQP